MKRIIHPARPWWVAPERCGMEFLWQRIDGLVVWLLPDARYLVFLPDELAGAGALELEGIHLRLRDAGLAHHLDHVEALNRRRLARILVAVDRRYPLPELLQLASARDAPRTRRWPKIDHIPL